MTKRIPITGIFRINLPKIKEVYVIRNSERIDVIMFENREVKFAKVPCKFRQTSGDLRKHVIAVILSPKSREV